MADTFAVDPGGAQGPGGQSGPVLARTQPSAQGIQTRQGASDGQSARTMDALLKLGSDALAPHIKEAQTSQFLQGVQQAAGGQGLTEILEEQPWYSNIFGPSSAAMGARAYTTQAAVAKFGADMERQMPQLAKQGPEALVAAAQASVKSMMTGDATADNAIMGAYVEQLQPLFKRQAKENYIYTQKQANAAQVTAWDTLFDAYQSRAKSAADPEGGTSQADMEAEAGRLIGAMQPFADQTDDSFQENIVNTLAGAARKGNFQAIKLMEREGVLKGLPPEKQGQLVQVFRTAGRAALDNAMPEFALDVAMLVNDTAQDPRGYVDRMRALNAKAAERLGIDTKYAQLVPESSADNVIGNILRGQAAAAAVQATAAQKAADAAAEVARANSQLGIPGGVAKGAAMGLFKDTVAEQAALAQWTRTSDPAKRASILNNRGAGKYDAIAADLRAMGASSTDKDTLGVQQVAATYAALNEETKGAYFSSDEQQFYDRYTSSVRAGVPPEAAFLTARVAQPLARDMIPETEKTDVHSAIRAEAENRHENFFGWNTVDDQGLRIIEGMIARDYRTNRGLNDVQTSVARSMTQALNNGLEIVGKHAILGKQPGQQPLTTILSRGENNMGAQEAAKRFETAMAAKAAAVGADVSRYVAIRSPDVDGDARFLVEFTTKEGAVKTQVITGAELRTDPTKPALKPAPRSRYVAGRVE